MAASALLRDPGLTGPASTVGNPPISALWHKRDSLFFQACKEEGRTSRRLQQLFSDPTQWWDNRMGSPHVTQLEIEEAQVSETVDALDFLVQRGCHIPNNFFYRLLKKCTAHKDLFLGKRIHALTVTSGYERNAFLATHLISLYASLGKLEDAMAVFSKVASPSSYNWAAMIFAYATHGESQQALVLYGRMRASGVKPNNRVFVAVLKACASTGNLAAGKDLHALILATPGEPDVCVQTSLVDMYAKCGSLGDARNVFDSLLHKTVVTWTAMIAGYVQQGMGQEALGLYSSMQQEGVSPPDSVTFLCLLQACAAIGVAAVKQGQQLHAQIEELGLHHEVVVGASLVNMYAKCGSLVQAAKVFNSLPCKTVVTWNAMIAGYSQQGLFSEALNLYSCMQEQGISLPNSVTFVCLLHVCASAGVGGLHHGRWLHAQIQEQGLQGDLVLDASLVNMYAKCGSLEDARKVFDKLPHKNVVVWTTMIAGYAQQGMGQEALSLYKCMPQEGSMPPDYITFLCLLQACASAGAVALHQGKQLHAQIEERGLQEDVALGAPLITMYAKCGSLEGACRVFDRLPHRDVVTWNTMIAGYAQKGLCQEALNLYSAMRTEGITPPNSVTFVCLLQACATVGVEALRHGQQLHAQIEEQDLQADVVVGGSLVNMYAKCGSVEYAERIFARLSHKNLVTWTAMMAGYAQQGMGQEALNLYSSMQEEGITSPDSVTFVCLLQACATVAALPLGKQIHAHIQEQGLQADGVVGSSLVHMYAKCGSMVDSQQVFDALPERGIGAWNALIAGYTRRGDGEVVFDLLDRMRLEGIQPDEITFVSVLTNCSHRGLLDDGRKYFEAMSTEYGIRPTVEHYSCMLDLLGRADHLDEALLMLKTLAFQPNSTMWHSLLGACQKWSNVEVGRQAFEFAVSLDEKDAACYVLMSNIYAGAEMWEEAKEMQARRVQGGAWKQPGQSWWTDLNGVVHTFLVGDRKLTQCEGPVNWNK